MVNVIIMAARCPLLLHRLPPSFVIVVVVNIIITAACE